MLPDSPPSRDLQVAIAAHALMRVGGSAGGVVVGIWLASLSRQALPIRADLVGALAASAFAAELLSSMPFGVLADAVSASWLMSGGALLGALALLLFGLTKLLPVFFLSRALEGIAIAAVTPALLRFLARATARDAMRRARIMGWFELSLLAGLALGGLVGTQLWTWQQRRAFDCLALLYAMAALLLFMGARRQTGRGREAAVQGILRAIKDPLVRRLAPIWLCVNAVIGVWLGPTLSFMLTQRPNSSQYLDGIFARDPTDLGWLLLGYTLVFGMGVTAWGALLPKTGPRHAMRVSLWAMGAVCATLALLNHSTHWPVSGRTLLGAMAALLIMVESGFGPAALSWLAQVLGPGDGAGAAMGMYSMLLSLGALAGSLLGGWTATLWRIDGMLSATALLAGLALFFLSRMPASLMPADPLLERDHGNVRV